MVGSVIRAILSKWFFAAYFLMGAICFFALPMAVSWLDWVKSFFVTLALMTGSDPYSFKELLESHGFLWLLAWLIHVASWLLIPALIALLITEAKDEIKEDQKFDTAVGRWLIEEGRSPADAKRFRDGVDALMKQITKPSKPAAQKPAGEAVKATQEKPAAPEGQEKQTSHGRSTDGAEDDKQLGNDPDKPKTN